jgi:hypothetical protein
MLGEGSLAISPSPSRCSFASNRILFLETFYADWLGELVPERSDGRGRG